MPSFTRFLSFAIAGVVVAGCDWPPSGTGSGSGSTGTPATSTVTPASSPPILEDASMSASASPANGEYVIFGSLTYECDACGTEDSVHTIRITVPVLGKSYDYPAGDTTQQYGQAFSFDLSDDIPLAGAGDTNYEIILITLGGVQSTPVLKTVTLL